MTKSLVLHIGAAKTGSSALQSFLRVNKDRLREKGFFVPDNKLGLRPNISGNHVMTMQGWINADDKASFVQAFQALHSDIPENAKILISAENLSNIGCHRFFEQVVPTFDETKVIFYIRRQDDLIASAWQQWHSKVEGDLPAWIVKALRQYGLWDRIIDDWKSVVGDSGINVRVFQKSDFKGGDLLHDFLDSLGIDCVDNEWNFDLGIVNPSYSDIITPLVTANRGVFRDANDNLFYQVLGDLTGESYIDKKRKVSLLSSRMRDSILYFYRDINQRVCKENFPGRSHLFEAIDHSKYDYITEEELRRRQMQFLTEAWFHLAERVRGSKA